jgi:hypothetical protein
MTTHKATVFLSCATHFPCISITSEVISTYLDTLQSVIVSDELRADEPLTFHNAPRAIESRPEAFWHDLPHRLPLPVSVACFAKLSSGVGRNTDGEPAPEVQGHLLSAMVVWFAGKNDKGKNKPREARRQTPGSDVLEEKQCGGISDAPFQWLRLICTPPDSRL